MTLAHKWGLSLIGFGLWLSKPKGKREPLRAMHFAEAGRWAVERLNHDYQQAEIARRHAKPSSRRRVV